MTRMWSIAYGPPKPDPYWGEPTSAVKYGISNEDKILEDFD